MPDRCRREISARRKAAKAWCGDPTVQSYRAGVERPVQEAVAKCVALRPFGAPRRPTKRVYNAAEGVKDPLRTAKQQLEELAWLRDLIAEDDVADFDGEYLAIATKVVEFALDARAASDERRRMAAQREA